MIRPSRSTFERLLGVALSGIALVAASPSFLPLAVHAEWHGQGAQFHGGAALYRSRSRDMSAVLCGRRMGVPPSAPIGPHTIHSLPTIVYGPYRGPDPRAGGSNLLRRTSCVSV